MLDRLINLLLGLVFIAALALSSCASRKPHATQPTRSEPIARADSTAQPPAGVVVQPHHTLLNRLTGRTPEPYTVKSTDLKVGKKATITIYQAPATVTTTTLGKKSTGAVGEGAVASVIEKKAGPAQVASDSSTQNALLGGGNLAAVQGNGNQLEQKAELKPEKSLLQTIWDNFKPALLFVAGVLCLGAIGFTLINTPAGPWLVALFKRRKSSSDNGTV